MNGEFLFMNRYCVYDIFIEIEGIIIQGSA